MNTTIQSTRGSRFERRAKNSNELSSANYDDTIKRRHVPTILFGIEDHCKQFISDCGKEKETITLRSAIIVSEIDYGVFNSQKYKVGFSTRWSPMEKKVGSYSIPVQYYIPSFLILREEYGQDKNLSILKLYKEISQFHKPKIHYLFYYKDNPNQSTTGKDMNTIINNLKMKQFDIYQSADVSSKLKVVASDVLDYDALCAIL